MRQTRSSSHHQVKKVPFWVPFHWRSLVLFQRNTENYAKTGLSTLLRNILKTSQECKTALASQYKTLFFVFLYVCMFVFFPFCLNVFYFLPFLSQGSRLKSHSLCPNSKVAVADLTRAVKNQSVPKLSTTEKF